MNSKARPSSSATAPWLLMIHQLPAKPAYLRVKIGRKLQALGAVAVKNAVYALPAARASAEAYCDLVLEVTEAGGEALVCEANLIAGLNDEEVRALFDAARDVDYVQLAAEGRALLKQSQINQTEIGRLRKRLDEIAAIDFFGAHGRQVVDDVIAEVQRRLQRHADVTRANNLPPPVTEDLKNRVWVTRRHIHVDRIASAWLIRRFIDPAATFKFVDAKTYKPKRRELRFDMANAEFTHEGDSCTFETLVTRAALTTDLALRAIAEIIHDLDIDDEKFGRPEAAGLGAMLGGVCAATPNDEERLSRATAGLDQFYAYFSKTR